MYSFPHESACVQFDGYKEYIGKSIPCFSGQSVANRTKIDLSVVCKNENNIKRFMYFYYREIRCNDAFTMNLPVSGVYRNWIVRMSTPVAEIQSKSLSRQRYSFSVTIFEDVSQHLQL